MIPATNNGLNAMDCISAMQKAIRLEGATMEFAIELMHTSKAMHTMVCNRLIVICQEDLEVIVAPHVFPFVAATVAASQDRYAGPRSRTFPQRGCQVDPAADRR